ncbi:MAG: diguanylate cyclase [Deltaproteobacteria bacterium]|nr:diguanylate cyclase [Deltaproteobacteria bacterium]
MTLNEFLKRKKVIDNVYLPTLLVILILTYLMRYYWQYPIHFMTLLRFNLVLTGSYILLHYFIERSGMGEGYVRGFTALSILLMLFQITVTIHYLGGVECFILFLLYIFPCSAAGILYSRWYSVPVAFVSAGLLAALYLLEDTALTEYLISMGLPQIFGKIFEKLSIPHYPVFGLELSRRAVFVIILSYFFGFLTFTVVVQILDYLYSLTYSMESHIKGREKLINLSPLHAPVGFMAGYRSDYKPLYMNKTIMDIFGLAAGETEGKDLFSIFTFEPAASNLIRRHIEKAEALDLPAVPVALRDGATTFFQIKLGFFNYPTLSGEEGLFLITMNNITEELRLSNLITNSRDVMVLIDASGKVNFYNRAAEEVFPDLLKGMPFKQILSGAGTLPEDESSAILDGKTVDGKLQLNEKLFLFSSSLLRDITGIELGILFSLRDITREELFYNLSIKDELTGLYNRRFFFETLEKEIAQAQRYGKPLSIAILDIDHFKKINDTYGHHAGDVILREFAGAISTEIRKATVVGRIGGEEFSIYIPFTDAAGAFKFCDKVRQRVQDLQTVVEGTVISITCSIGITGYVKGDTVKDFIGRADAALYEAKRSGRNRVIAHPALLSLCMDNL